MYAHIEGVVAEKTQDAIVLDANGVGYLLNVSGATLAAAPAVGERMKLYCVLSVREDAMELFGFYSREEKKMYERLRSVSGVGSRTALGVLSTLSLRDLSLAILTGDAASIARAPNVGKKTAQRIILELKDKVDQQDVDMGGAPAAAALNPDAAQEAVQALLALGYSGTEAQRAVNAVRDKADTADMLILLALKGLGG